MKKLKKTSVGFLMILVLLLGLAGCVSDAKGELPKAQIQVQDDTNSTGDKVADETLPEETLEQKENYTQSTVEETVPKETESVPRETENQKEKDKTPIKDSPDSTEETQGSTETPQTETQPTTSNIEPSQGAQPSVQPEETVPSPEETEPEKEQIDISMIENHAETYAQALGFIVDSSLRKGNAGYYSPDYRPLYTTQEGCNAATGLVSATKNQLNSRFTEEYCDTLVEEAYGYARVNCTVVFSHTDELGDWYYIYVFYG